MKTTTQRFYIKTFLQRRIILLFLLLSFQLPLLAVDYYWVGGGGIYSDISHWATTSGGSVKYTLPPNATDNVYFDTNSGFDIQTQRIGRSRIFVWTRCCQSSCHRQSCFKQCLKNPKNQGTINPLSYFNK